MLVTVYVDSLIQAEALRNFQRIDVKHVGETASTFYSVSYQNAPPDLTDFLKDELMHNPPIELVYQISNTEMTLLKDLQLVYGFEIQEP
ncbi:MAG: hypothetical protein JSS79_05200 [Bacteroidetes bacterium]|nr:hypothetical protein [Bacteroidota bacterium]